MLRDAKLLIGSLRMASCNNPSLLRVPPLPVSQCLSVVNVTSVRLSSAANFFPLGTVTDPPIIKKGLVKLFLAGCHKHYTV